MCLIDAFTNNITPEILTTLPYLTMPKKCAYPLICLDNRKSEIHTNYWAQYRKTQYVLICPDQLWYL
jgi:hypothetical protein